MSTSYHDDYINDVYEENIALKKQAIELQSENRSLSDAMIKVCDICHGLLVKNNKLEEQVEASLKEAG